MIRLSRFSGDGSQHWWDIGAPVAAERAVVSITLLFIPGDAHGVGDASDVEREIEYGFLASASD